MRDFVSYIVAVALKRCEFPQPEKKRGQLWYFNLYGDVQLIAIQKETSTRDDLVYAPGIPDLLKELGSEYFLSFNQEGELCLLWGRELETVLTGDNIANDMALLWMELTGNLNTRNQNHEP